MAGLLEEAPPRLDVAAAWIERKGFVENEREATTTTAEATGARAHPADREAQRAEGSKPYAVAATMAP